MVCVLWSFLARVFDVFFFGEGREVGGFGMVCVGISEGQS